MANRPEIEKLTELRVEKVLFTAGSQDLEAWALACAVVPIDRAHTAQHGLESVRGVVARAWEL